MTQMTKVTADDADGTEDQPFIAQASPARPASGVHSRHDVTVVLSRLLVGIKHLCYRRYLRLHQSLALCGSR